MCIPVSVSQVSVRTRVLRRSWAAAPFFRPGPILLRALLIASFAVGACAYGQSAETVYVVTFLDVRPAQLLTGITLTKHYVRETGAEAGNVAVSAYQQIGRPSQVAVIEVWRNSGSLADHEKAAHTLAFRERLEAVHRSPYDERVTHGFNIDPLPAAANPKALYVLTHLDVSPPSREPTEALLEKLAVSSRADAGHVRYDILQQNEPHKNHFTLLAVWDGRRSFDAYGGARHWLEFREALAPMLGALYDERVYRSLGQ